MADAATIVVVAAVADAERTSNCNSTYKKKGWHHASPSLFYLPSNTRFAVQIVAITTGFLTAKPTTAPLRPLRRLETGKMPENQAAKPTIAPPRPLRCMETGRMSGNMVAKPILEASGTLRGWKGGILEEKTATKPVKSI